MKESSTYQAILEEGRSEGTVAGATKILLRLGTRRFGPPEAPVRAEIENLNSLERLEELTDRLLDVASWDELLASS